MEKATYRLRNLGTEFVWPYNLGRLANLQQVVTIMSCKPSGDGIIWPVVEGTDQYTLTREQLMQKEEKRGRTREYGIILAYTGAWFPLSQGLGVCCHPPCTDEPRILLQAGDMVKVTRWKKYWLYGEKVQVGDKGRVRGWFPRQWRGWSTTTPVTRPGRWRSKRRRRTIYWSCQSCLFSVND